MKAAKNFLTGYIKLFHVYVKLSLTSQSCLSSKCSQPIRVEWRPCDRNGKQFFQWKLEKFLVVYKVGNVLIEKNIF